MFYVCYNADDRRPFRICVVPRYAFFERFATGKVLFRERLVDDHHWGRIGRVGLAKETPFQQRCLQHTEKTRRDVPNLLIWERATRLWILPLDDKRAVRVRAAQRQHYRERGILDTGNIFDPPLRFSVKITNR